MIDYRAGTWGFHVAFGLRGSLAPRALTVAVPNALITLLVSLYVPSLKAALFDEDASNEESSGSAKTNASAMILTTLTVILTFILYNRSRTSYDRWWEGGTLLQKTRGEWFNAYSSLVAFASTKPEMRNKVTTYLHFLARMMSLLMCCGLQQVSPNRDRPFEVIDLDGIDPACIDFLNVAPDKCELLLQWIQRSVTLEAESGVLPIAPPILSRAYQELSRGIVNLQNARKIADFPYPYPLAQLSMILQMVHYVMTPVVSALALRTPWAVALSFTSIFVLWSIHFNALDLEFPFGSRVNDLPMVEMQRDWNMSLCTLLKERASKPPKFLFDSSMHGQLLIAMSDASEVYLPSLKAAQLARRNVPSISIARTGKRFSVEYDEEGAGSHEDPSPNRGAARLAGSFVSEVSTCAGESRSSSRTSSRYGGESRTSGISSRYSGMSLFSMLSRQSHFSRPWRNSQRNSHLNTAMQGADGRPQMTTQLSSVMEATESMKSNEFASSAPARTRQPSPFSEFHQETPVSPSQHEPSPANSAGETSKGAVLNTQSRSPCEASKPIDLSRVDRPYMTFQSAQLRARLDQSRSNSPTSRELSPSHRSKGGELTLPTGSSRSSSSSSESQGDAGKSLTSTDDPEAGLSPVASENKPVVDIDIMLRGTSPRRCAYV